jgi:sugar phosphate isomerase/epimerase
MNNQLWIMSSAYPALSLEELVKTAVEIGAQGIELCVFRRQGTRTDHIATHLEYDGFSPAEARRIIDLFNENKLRLSLGSYENCIGGTDEERTANQNHLLKIIRLAHLLGGEDNGVKVGTFVGYNHDLGMEEFGFQKNLEEYRKIFTPIIKYAENLNVVIVYENCPMEGWRPASWPTTYNNLPATLAARKLMYALIESDNHGEIYDPSHDVWQHTDPSEILKNTDVRKLRGIHIKGTRNLKVPGRTYWGGLYPMQRVDENLAQKAGVPTCRNEWDRHHYEPMVPGFGGSDSMDWRLFIETAFSVGFDDPFIVENEAANSKATGCNGAITQGFIAAKHFLMPMIWKLAENGYAYDYSLYRPLRQTGAKDIPIRTIKEEKF